MNYKDDNMTVSQKIGAELHHTVHKTNTAILITDSVAAFVCTY